MKTILLALLVAAPVALADPEIVALTILGEARGESPQGQLAIGCIIKQRAANRGLTYDQVCLQRKQFSCWNGKTKADLEHMLKLPQAKLAMWIAHNIHRLDTAKIGHADHYHADYVDPDWADAAKVTVKIGRHIFYKLK